ncbi:MAG: hypothetical protein M3R60_01135 [Pseudomonadota bacterium]|nr:hypothetical protein [Pseudomonadota bacterium]
MNDDLTRFQRLCFLHACDKLDGEDAAWMESMMAADPALRDVFDADLQLAGSAKAALALQRDAAPPLTNFHAVIDALNARTLAPAPLRWWRRWWHGSLPAGWATAGMAMLAVFGAMQTARLNGLLQPAPSEPTYRSVRPAPALNITFRDSATAGAVRALLFQLKLDVVRGPDEQGVYTVSVTEGSPQAALERLRSSGLVVDAYAVKVQQ